MKKGFEKLTPGRQREYLEYIDTAKREETKIARMDKIKPMIILVLDFTINTNKPTRMARICTN